MKQANYTGVGIYSIADAARLTGLSARKIRRWVLGYAHGPRGDRRRSKAIWKLELPAIDGQIALTFRDLMELRFVAAFLDQGVSWTKLRKGHARACDLAGTQHPFCTNKFKTDGHQIFADMLSVADERSLVEVTSRQHYFERFLRPLLKDLEFEGDALVRWWPRGRKRSVVLDPERNFGRPIVQTQGVSTYVLAQAFEANESIAEVCRWYDVSAKELRDALVYENSNRAA